LDNLEMAAKLEAVISTLQEQRSMLLTKNLGDGAATEAIAQKDARIEQLKEELAKVVRESESHRTEIIKRDMELRKLREDAKRLKESESAAVAAAKKSAGEVEMKVAEARARAEREMATAARNAPVAQPGRHQSSDEMIRKIAMLNSKSLHLEAENERYKRLYDQIEAEVTKLRKQAKESAAAAAAAVANAAAANTAAEEAKAAADMEKNAEATKGEASIAPAETPAEPAASTAKPLLSSSQPVAAPAVETAAPAPASKNAAPSAAQVAPEASTTDDLNVDIVSSDSELVLTPASIEHMGKAADGLSALPMAEP
jgi:myosin heavy subunit